MTKNGPSARDLALTADYQAGVPRLRELAAKYGISVWRVLAAVRDTLRATGEPRRPRERSYYGPYALAITPEDKAAYLRGDLDVKGVAAKYGCSWWKTRRYLRALGLPGPRAVRARNARRRHEQAYEAFAGRGFKDVRGLAAEMGLPASTLSFRLCEYRRLTGVPTRQSSARGRAAMARSRGRAS
jgi:hypothetical protein